MVYIYTFIVIYMPPITNLTFNIPIHFFIGLLLCVTIIPFIIIKVNKNRNITIDKDVFFLIIGIMVSSIFFAIRAALDSNELRLLQNNFILVQILHVIIIIEILKANGYKRYDMLQFLLNLGLIQGIICIIMIVIPEFRDLALSLYYLGREENIFISRMRIYGISGDYTYFTPIFHGTLATIASILAVLKDYKYLIYLPFLLISILLNGRFGLAVFILGTISAYLAIFIRRPIKIIKYILILIIIIMLGLLLIMKISPFTYSWILGGFQDTIDLIFYKELEGNYDVLLNSHLFFPESWGIIFGEGHRVYSVEGKMRGYNSSDIGYINDMFMGGLIYLTILYGSIFRFLLRKRNKKVFKNKIDRLVDKVVPISLVVILIISNFKGEAMRSGTILLGCIFIKLILTNKQLDEN